MDKGCRTVVGNFIRYTVSFRTVFLELPECCLHHDGSSRSKGPCCSANICCPEITGDMHGQDRNGIYTVMTGEENQQVCIDGGIDMFCMDQSLLNFKKLVCPVLASK